MIDNTTALLIHWVACFALFWSVFCRAVKSSKRVRIGIRLAFFGLGGAALVGMAAPLAWSYVPHPVALAMEVAFAVVQVVTAALWADGPPTPFIKPRFRARRRRASDSQSMCEQPSGGA